MNPVWPRLGVNFAINWWQQYKKNTGFWISLFLLALPMSFYVHAYLINIAYNTPQFIGVDKPENVQQIRLIGSTDLPIPVYLAEESIPNFQYNIVYEKNQWVEIGETDVIDVEASFFSGDYESFGISPAFGNLDNLDFPHQTSQIHIAISHRFWKNQLKSKPTLGKTLIINGEIVIVDAILKPEFKSFRQQNAVDIIIPFSYLSRLTLSSLEDLSPDVLSYIVSDSLLNSKSLDTINQYFKDQLLLPDNEELIVSSAFGYTIKEYNEVQARLGRLIQLFTVLFVFSFIAFLSHQINDNQNRQNERTLRTYLGANRYQLTLQSTVENLLNFISLAILLLFMLPVSKILVRLVIPTLDTTTDTGFTTLFTIFGLVLAFFFIMSNVTFFLQNHFLNTSLGRGDTASRGQKLQTFVILSVMVSLSCISVIRGIELVQIQLDYYQKDRGFDSTDLYVVNFDFPRQGGTFYANELPKLLVESLETQEHIDSVALTTMPFMMGRSSYENLFTPSMQPLGGTGSAAVLTSSISPNFFDASGISLLIGENMEWGRYNDVVISHSLYKKYFDGQPLTQVKLIGKYVDGTTRTIDVVGVAADVYYGSLDDDPASLVYGLVPTITGFESILLRSKATAPEVLQSVNTGIQSIDNSFQNPKLFNVTALIEEQQSPQVALLSMSLILRDPHEFSM